MHIDKIFTLHPSDAVINGVQTGATIVIVIDTGDDRGCWLGQYDRDGRPVRITIAGAPVRAGAGWSTGAQRVK